MIKLFLSFFIPFTTVLFLYWLGNNEFVRSPGLSFTTGLALYAGGAGVIIYKVFGGE